MSLNETTVAVVTRQLERKRSIKRIPSPLSGSPRSQSPVPTERRRPTMDVQVASFMASSFN